MGSQDRHETGSWDSSLLGLWENRVDVFEVFGRMVDWTGVLVSYEERRQLT
jgi:hypothetical protein